ncbi:MAG: hypothetical protein GC168_21760 [Candidatus Hydrogenedens sp.]|nr:hypothetical protein [Candidatus Hydrogenedens sp.]
MSGTIAIGATSFARHDDTPLQLLRAAGVDIRECPYPRRLSEAEAAALIQDADGWLAGGEVLGADALEAASGRLKAIARPGIDTGTIDCDSASRLGIAVSFTPEIAAEAVAEMTLSALLALTRKIVPLNASMHAGKWEPLDGVGLRGRKALVVGYGHVGRRVSELLQAFGCVVSVTEPNLNGNALPPGVPCVPLETGLAEADIVTLHARGAEALLDDAAFGAMKRGALLLNCAQAALIQKSALIRALESEIVSAAWFDCFWEEPYGGILGKYENVLLTPHCAARTPRCLSAMELQSAKNLLRDLGIPVPEMR